MLSLFSRLFSCKLPMRPLHVGPRGGKGFRITQSQCVATGPRKIVGRPKGAVS